MPAAEIIAAMEMARVLIRANNRPEGGYRLHFDRPLSFWAGRRYQDVKNFTVRTFMNQCGGLYVSARKNATLYKFEHLDKVVRLEVLEPKPDKFANFIEFAKIFDRRFISDEKINELWQERRPPSDFRRMGKRAQDLLQEFLRSFTDWRESGISYNQDNRLISQYRCWGNQGMKISFEHLAGNGLVWYSTTYQYSPRARYYLLVNEKPCYSLSATNPPETNSAYCGTIGPR